MKKCVLFLALLTAGNSLSAASSPAAKVKKVHPHSGAGVAVDDDISCDEARWQNLCRAAINGDLTQVIACVGQGALMQVSLEKVQDLLTNVRKEQGSHAAHEPKAYNHYNRIIGLLARHVDLVKSPSLVGGTDWQKLSFAATSGDLLNVGYWLVQGAFKQEMLPFVGLLLAVIKQQQLALVKGSNGIDYDHQLFNDYERIMQLIIEHANLLSKNLPSRGGMRYPRASL
ncbi:hypothetical protein K2X40_00490 [Candidatus Babeliales bacterium]|nr:hypothetical protein [Candidatus Babeliales bacterium]